MTKDVNARYGLALTGVRAEIILNSIKVPIYKRGFWLL
jgi:hypothetical protein